jgi:2-dehydropantoate 2-reductase
MLAVRLALAGNRTICVARPGTVSAIGQDGLRLATPAEELHAYPEPLERLSEQVDLLLVTVKAPALDEALGRIAEPPALTLPLLNGLEHVDVIRARLRSTVVVGSIGRFEAFRAGPARIVQRTSSALVAIASDNLQAGKPEETVAVLTRAGIDAQLRSSGRAVLWEKAVRMAPLAALTAATGRTVGQLRADRRLRAGIEEACAVATADGVPAAPEEQWAIIDAMPSRLTTSTARDVAAGLPSELDAITGSVVRAGRRLGVPTPVLEELLELCRA